jgi:hypothetical protein
LCGRAVGWAPSFFGAHHDCKSQREDGGHQKDGNVVDLRVSDEHAGGLYARPKGRLNSTALQKDGAHPTRLTKIALAVIPAIFKPESSPAVFVYHCLAGFRLKDCRNDDVKMPIPGQAPRFFLLRALRALRG